MNKKGFTLIEIIATVIILVLISLLSFPIILNLVKNEETKLSEANRTLIKTAASQYTSEFENAFPKIPGNYYCITVNDLVKRDFLINYNDEFNLDTNILIRVNLDKKYEYDIMGECDNSNTTPSIVVKNKNGVFNSDGWANKNFYVSIIGTGSSYYKCVSDTECVPDTLVNKPSGEEYILTEGNNIVCAKARNNSNESEIVCSDEFKLDTTSPTKPVISVNDISTLEKEIILTTPSTDETSGISHYEYALTSSLRNPNDNELISTDGSTLNLNLTSSDRYIYYRAVDKAGNKSDYVSVSLQSGSFNFAINEYGKIEIVDIDLPDNYVLKYKYGNLTAGDVLGGTDITNSRSFDVYGVYYAIYTVSAFVDNEEVVTKKIYIYNSDYYFTYKNKITINASGVTNLVGGLLSDNAIGTVSLSGSILTFDIENAELIMDYYCSELDKYELQESYGEYVCVSYGSYNASSIYKATCSQWGSTMTWSVTADESFSCASGFTEYGLPNLDGYECSESNWGEVLYFDETCTATGEQFLADVQEYYRYTLGVEVE